MVDVNETLWRRQVDQIVRTSKDQAADPTPGDTTTKIPFPSCVTIPCSPEETKVCIKATANSTTTSRRNPRKKPQKSRSEFVLINKDLLIYQDESMCDVSLFCSNCNCVSLNYLVHLFWLNWQISCQSERSVLNLSSFISFRDLLIRIYDPEFILGCFECYNY